MQNNRWYVVRTSAGEEISVVASLVGLGMIAYTPVVVEKRSRGGHTGKRTSVAIARGAFPGYAFLLAPCQVDRARAVKGWVGILHQGQSPVFAADWEVHAIKSRELRGEFSINASVRSEFQIGNLVVVAEGPYQGISGSCVSNERGGRVNIRLGSMPYSVTIRAGLLSTKK